VAGGATIYDEVVYPNRPSTRTTPARLAVAPALFGLDHAPPERCRVLEIGGGDGGNLIPMAAASPGAEFVGFDLAPARVAAGREVIAALGLANIRLEALDILDAGDLGRFDYVVAHGVYSWVPAAVREALFPLIRRSLAPGGVAYVDYNALPGCALRQALHRMLFLHLEGVDDARARLAEGLRFLRLIAEGAAEAQPLQQALRAEAAALLKRPPHVLFHDELNPFYTPVYLQEFLDHAARHGLQHLAEAEGTRLRPAPPDNPAARELLAGVAEGSAERQQYVDYLAPGYFRRTLLCAADRSLDRTPDPARLRGLHAAALLRRDETTPGRYVGPAGATLRTADTLLAAWLNEAGEVFPSALPLAAADERLFPKLLNLHTSGLLDLQAGPSPFVTEPGERPQASAFARLQASRGETELTTLAHTQTTIRDPATLHLISLLDGSRTRGELAAAMAARLGRPPGGDLAPLERALRSLARNALLEA
jgi:SAM-dependent methyltransferase